MVKKPKAKSGKRITGDSLVNFGTHTIKANKENHHRCTRDHRQ